MSDWAYASFSLSALFLLLAIIFLIFKEKACILISRYNFKSKKERITYDELRMSKDYRVFWLICSSIFILGGTGCILISDNFFWAALIIWLIYYIIHAGISDKVFDKYKKN